MRTVIVFSGTTEGRKIAGVLRTLPVRSLVYVATEYGLQVMENEGSAADRNGAGETEKERQKAAERSMPEISGQEMAVRSKTDSREQPEGESVFRMGENQEVHIGRLNRDEMLRLFDEVKPDLVVDATHPYAVIVTENIAGSCADTDVPCIRVERETGGTAEDTRTGAGKPGDAGTGKTDDAARGKTGGAGTGKTGGSGKEKAGDGDKDACKVVEVQSAQEAAAYLEHQDGNIFLTTGSKELDAFSSMTGFSERVFARVLPTASNFEKCDALGLHGRNLIMMQGPFSEELNLAMFRSTDARWMVTKAAGRTGGFPEKMRAAQKLGIGIIVIGRPEEKLPECEKKMTLKETEDYLIRIFAEDQEKQ